MGEVVGALWGRARGRITGQHPFREEMMIYCPRCGRPCRSSQRFCTGCGLHVPTILQALEGASEQLARRVKALRSGLQTMFSGIGLTLFFYFFFDHSVGFAAIGLMVFFTGLGQVLSAMLFASPASRLQWRFPSPPPEAEGSLPPPDARADAMTRDLAEPPTIPLNDTRPSRPPA
jgi:hypothetical protein